MEWINIKDRQPNYNQLVLVKGKRTNTQKDKIEIGLVYWSCRGESNYRVKHSVKDYYINLSVEYDNITEWCEVTE